AVSERDEELRPDVGERGDAPGRAGAERVEHHRVRSDEDVDAAAEVLEMALPRLRRVLDAAQPRAAEAAQERGRELVPGAGRNRVRVRGHVRGRVEQRA